MRFTKEKEIREAYWKSTRKTKTKFLWWPVTIGGETRWLETVTIEYRVNYDYGLFVDRYYYWEPFNFIDK
jgi:hypothetical protein